MTIPSSSVRPRCVNTINSRPFRRSGQLQHCDECNCKCSAGFRITDRRVRSRSIGGMPVRFPLDSCGNGPFVRWPTRHASTRVNASCWLSRSVDAPRSRVCADGRAPGAPRPPRAWSHHWLLMVCDGIRLRTRTEHPRTLRNIPHPMRAFLARRTTGAVSRGACLGLPFSGFL